MAFPTTGILDSGTAADENPLSTGWSDFTPFHADVLRRLSNQFAGRAAGQNASYYDLATFGPASEVYVTMNTAPLNFGERLDIWTNLNAPTVSASTTGYRVRITKNATWNMQMGRRSGGVTTSVGAATNLTAPVANDRFGLEFDGSNLTAYHFRAGAWNQIVTWPEPSPFGSGFVALQIEGTVGRCTNFGGGTIVVAGGATTRMLGTLGVGT